MKTYPLIACIILLCIINGRAQKALVDASIKLDNENCSGFFNKHPKVKGFIEVNSESFIINGTLTIDEDILFRDCHFYMQPGSEIIVNSSKFAQFKSSVLVACDTSMWRGIRGLPNSITHIKDTRVYDALAGYTSQGNAYHDIFQSYFNRNWIDIDIQANVSVQTGKILLSHLYCHIDAPDQYYGNSLPPSDGLLLFPHRHEVTRTGILINDNAQVTVGALRTEAVPHNLIEDMPYGIISNASSLNVFTTDFNHIKSLRSGFMGAIRTGGDAIQMNTTNISQPNRNLVVEGIHSDNNIFTDIDSSCIHMKGKFIEANIVFNEMQSNKFGILGLGIGSNSAPAPFNMINIQNNSIDHVSGGILLDNIRKSYFSILGNSLECNNATATNLRIQSLTTLPLALHPRYRIYRNTITNGIHGIDIFNIKRTVSASVPKFNMIDNNYIYSNKSDPTGVIYNGISLVNSSGSMLRCNLVRGEGSDVVYGNVKIAIRVASSTGWKIVSNELYDMTSGINFMGNCNSKNSLAANSFNLHYAAIQTWGASPAFSGIGDQLQYSLYDPLAGTSTDYFQANEFTAPIGYSIVDANMTQFKMLFRRVPSLYDFSPPSYNVLPDPFPAWTSRYYEMDGVIIPFIAPYPSDVCIAAVDLLEQDTSSEEGTIIDASTLAYLQLIALEDSIIEEELAGNLQIDDEDLYALLMKDTSLWSNDTFFNFLQANRYEHIGRLYEVKELMNAQANITAGALLNAMPYANDREQANIIVSQIQNNLEQREEYICTESEINSLLDIASYCPIRYGQAVYGARALLHTQQAYTTLVWDDQNICIQGVNYKNGPQEANDTDTTLKMNKVVIYPNPNASGILMFTLQTNSQSICTGIVKYIIRDASGKKVAEQVYYEARELGAIDISKFTSGSYSIDFMCSSGYEYHLSFVVNH